MYGHAAPSTSQVRTATGANTSAPVNIATAATAWLSRASATSQFQNACSAAEPSTSATAAALVNRRRARRTARRSRSRPRSSRRRAVRVTSPTRPASSAATAHAPDGSATVLRRSNRNRIASTISASDASSTASTRSRITANVSSPGERQLLAVGDRARHRRSAPARRPPATGARRRPPRARRRPPARPAAAPSRGRAARDQPAAADADEQHVERPGVLDQLERDGALAGHHALVVVRVDRDRARARRRARRAAPRGPAA